jgi:hypothetical protein
LGNLDADGHKKCKKFGGKEELYSSGSQKGFFEHDNEIYLH